MIDWWRFSSDWTKASCSNRKMARKAHADAFRRHKIALLIICDWLLCSTFFLVESALRMVGSAFALDGLQWASLALWFCVLTAASVLALCITFDERHSEEIEKLKESRYQELSLFLTERGVRTIDQLELLVQCLSSTQKELKEKAKDSINLFLGIVAGVLGSIAVNELGLEGLKEFELTHFQYATLLGAVAFLVIGLIAIGSYSIRALYRHLNRECFRSVFLEECSDLYYSLRNDQIAGSDHDARTHLMSYWSKGEFCVPLGARNRGLQGTGVGSVFRMKSVTMGEVAKARTRSTACETPPVTLFRPFGIFHDLPLAANRVR